MFAKFRMKTRPPRRGEIPPKLAVLEMVDLDDSRDDLPCPWCHAGTSETDERCPSCGRSFGELHLQL